MGELITVLVIGTTVWVGVDAARLGVRRGSLGSGVADMGVLGWVVCCLLLWVVTFPVYLVTRERYVRLRREAITSPAPYGYPAVPAIGYGRGGAYAWSASDRLPAPATAPTVTQELERLASLRSSGALSEDEFRLLKGRLIRG